MTQPNSAGNHITHNTLLFIASGNTETIQIALHAFHSTYPKATFDVVVRQNASDYVSTINFCTIVHVTGNAKGRLHLIRHIRNKGYSTIAFVEDGSGGFIALQALALLSGGRTTVLADENGSIIAVGANAATLNHVRRRLKHSWKIIPRSMGQLAIRNLLAPLGIIILIFKTCILICRATIAQSQPRQYPLR